MINITNTNNGTKLCRPGFLSGPIPRDPVLLVWHGYVTKDIIAELEQLYKVQFQKLLGWTPLIKEKQFAFILLKEKFLYIVPPERLNYYVELW